jgi:hypothetical protein
MGAKENVETIRRAKTITATIILRENGWLKAIFGSKRDDIGYQHDKDNYIRISIITCVLYQIFLKVDRQCSRHGEMINV